MSIPLFLAMTSAELSSCPQPPEAVAWLSLHFSLSTPGLSNQPSMLPPGSLLILDDRNPWKAHSIEMVCRELTALLLQHQAYGLLLDFERPPQAETLLLVHLLCQCCKELHVPLSAPPAYSQCSDVIPFLSPLPFCPLAAGDAGCHTPRWLDASPAALEVILSEHTPASREIPIPIGDEIKQQPNFFSASMQCQYFTRSIEEGVRLTMFRTADSIRQTLLQMDAAAFPLAVGLWRDFRRECQKDVG